MKLKIDHENDALYFRLDETTKIVESEEVEPGVILDFDENGRVVGLGMLALSMRIAPKSCACYNSRLPETTGYGFGHSPNRPTYSSSNRRIIF